MHSSSRGQVATDYPRCVTHDLGTTEQRSGSRVRRAAGFKSPAYLRKHRGHHHPRCKYDRVFLVAMHGRLAAAAEMIASAGTPTARSGLASTCFTTTPTPRPSRRSPRSPASRKARPGNSLTCMARRAAQNALTSPGRPGRASITAQGQSRTVSRNLSRSKIGPACDLVLRGVMRARVFVDQAAQDGFPEDRSAVEIGNGEVAAPSGARWAMPWCGRVVL